MKNTQAYIPVATAIPALATFQAVEAPSNWKNHIPSGKKTNNYSS